MELKENLYYVGVIDHSLKVFDVAVLTDYGSSYNSYLLKTEEGDVLFEGVKIQFSEELFENVRKVSDFERIKYLVVSHAEPDHSGAIAKILELNPDITIVASFAALNNLSNMFRRPFKKLQMNPANPLKVGQYTLSFVSGLMLHWPDVMFTYIVELKTLISCDAFGAHFASDAILLSKEKNKEGYYKALEYYFQNIMGPFGSFVLSACDRIEKLDVEMICTGHGPVIDVDVKKQIYIYRKLANSVNPINDDNHVTLVYASCYGYTKEMALILKDKLEKDGKKVSFYEIDALNYAEIKEKILEDIRTSGLLLLGSPTLVGDAISLFYDLLSRLTWTMAQGKKASAFGDYGWSGEAVANLSSRLSILKFKVIPGFRYQFKMDENGLKQLDSYYDSLK